MATQIFTSQIDFNNRTDKSLNGVSEQFAAENLSWELHNESNTGCWNCEECENCTNCVACKDCNDCLDCQYCNLCNNCNDCTSLECGSNDCGAYGGEE